MCSIEEKKSKQYKMPTITLNQNGAGTIGRDSSSHQTAQSSGSAFSSVSLSLGAELIPLNQTGGSIIEGYEKNL